MRKIEEILNDRLYGLLTGKRSLFRRNILARWWIPPVFLFNNWILNPSQENSFSNRFFLIHRSQVSSFRIHKRHVRLKYTNGRVRGTKHTNSHMMITTIEDEVYHLRNRNVNLSILRKWLRSFSPLNRPTIKIHDNPPSETIYHEPSHRPPHHDNHGSWTH